MDEDDMLDLGRYLKDQFPDDAPREPGKFKILMGEPTSYSVILECEFCGKKSGSKGVSFSKIECKMHPDLEHCLGLHVHYGEDCPHIKWRIHRFKRKFTNPVHRNIMRFKWRHRMNKERRDPNAWLKFWSGKDDE